VRLVDTGDSDDRDVLGLGPNDRVTHPLDVLERPHVEPDRLMVGEERGMGAERNA
jgi:hypothetical protein